MNENNGYNNNNMNNNIYSDFNPGNTPQPVVNNNNISSTCKLTLKRAKTFVASLVSFKIFIDGELVGKIKNGHIVTFDVTRGQHEISINKKNPTFIVVNGDTTADVVIIGANNFGIANINGESGSMQNSISSTPNYSSKYETQALSILIASVLLPIISVILYMVTNHKYVLQFWFYSIIIGYGIINIFGLKNIKGSDKYKSLIMKNVIAVVIAIISLIVTLYITNFA